MFKLKRAKQKTSSLDPRVHFKKSSTKTPERKRSKARIKKSPKNQKYAKRNKRHNYKKIFQVFLMLFSIVILLFLLYKAIFWIIELRATNSDSNTNASFVEGFDDLLAYPYSNYIFETDENSTISQFLSTGRSIYRLDRDQKIDNVFKFYSENLEDSSWDHIQSVPRTSHEMMYGEYYYNNELGFGVRIYDRVNDIWYEKVTEEDALTGKAAQMSKKYQRDLILSSDEGTELLPDYPWSLTVPKEYLTKYFPTNKEDLRGITFTELATGKETVLEPVSQLTDVLDDLYIEEYIGILNARSSEEDNSKWELINTRYIDINGVYLLEGSISHSSEITKVYILHNQRVKYAYAIHLLDNDDAFLQFLLINMSEQKSDYTGDEFKLND